MPKPAPSALTLPTQAPSVVEGDPAFADLRRHYGAFRAGVTVVLGAGIAMGAEIARLRSIVQPKHGDSKRLSSKCNTVALGEPIPWRDLVKSHAKVDHETARRAEKVASDLRMSLEGKRDKLSVRARHLLDHPGEIATFDDYETLSQVAGKTYDADTWHGILVEAGILRRPVTNPGGGNQEPVRRLSLPELAKISATAYLHNLREARAHREEWRKRLAALPLDPTGDKDEPSLSDLHAEVKDQLVEIEEIMHHKKHAA